MSDDNSPVVPATTLAMTVVAAVHLKLPPQWPVDPEVWFTQVEAQFMTRGITVQRTKYNYIVASLLPEITKVRDLILRPPPENPYDNLKTQRTTASALQRGRAG